MSIVKFSWIINVLTSSKLWLLLTMSVYAVIVAAGHGRRFGAAKQFIEYKGIPILLHTLRHFNLNNNINYLIVAVPRERIRSTQNLIKNAEISKVKAVISGGKRRQDSVLKCLQKIKERSGIVAIHDGVRPVISQQLINRGIKLCKRYGAVIFGLPIYDTLKKVAHHRIVETISRDGLFLAQTPQFFKLNILRNAYKKIDQACEYTDDAAILEKIDIPVYLFKGDPTNIKLTEKRDLKLLYKIL